MRAVSCSAEEWGEDPLELGIGEGSYSINMGGQYLIYLINIPAAYRYYPYIVGI